MGVQQYATSGTRLQLPYTFFGLGRTNNYIENFVMAVAKNGSGSEDWSFMWTPIIPNSQLIIAANDVLTRKWDIDIFISPTEALFKICISTVAVLVVLGAFIMYFHWQEKKEDRKENEQSYSIF